MISSTKALRFPGLFFAICVAGLVGCGGGSSADQRAAVRGSVSLDNQPIDGATINFIALDSQGRNVGATTIQGDYEIPAERGPNPGRYRVEISWHRPLGPVPEMGDEFDDARPEPETRQVLPAQYNEQSTLEVVIEPGENEHSFQLSG